ncbi:trypsin-like peptidase domain-containing protein [Oscillatoria sp. FACHB-1406]|uniref:VMAP-C domain-containing protein n=1 Tax=Oscillatoria sp. FACHB-1406 TaxID=2692846 RepID=UPI0016849500|nr:trypsin-like peptidase domain-containing protein [Oscillatoria sp. FACHB-1406]
MTDKFETYKRAIARILDSAGATRGTGFLVSSQYIFTCTHVIEQVLGISCSGDLPETEIELEFPFNSPCLQQRAKVIFWKPNYNFLKALEGIDIALLELCTPLPSDVKPIPVAKEKTQWNDDFRVLGFPEGYDLRGDWAKGKILGEQAGGWLQLHAEISILPGYSGAPVWDEQKQGVVGMMTRSDVEHRKADAISIQALANTWKQQGQLIRLLNPHFVSSKRIIEEAYRACRPSGWQSEFPTTLADCVFDLSEMPTGENNCSRIVEFASKLVPAFPSLFENLKKWAKNAFQIEQQEFDRLCDRAVLTQKQPTTQSYLFIFVRSNETSDRYNLEAGILMEEDERSSVTRYQTLTVNLPPLSRSQLATLEPKLLTDILEQSRQLTQGKLQIECFLPYTLLDLAIDRWKRDDEYDEPFPLSEEYPVVVRILERLGYSKPYLKNQEWREKWKCLQQNACCFEILACCDRAREKVAEDLERGYIGLRRKTIVPPASEPGGMFSIIMKEGIPVTLWSRQDIDSCGEAERYEQLLKVSVVELPNRLKAIRNATPRKDETHIGHHLSLLWDNPYRVPPDAPSFRSNSL